MEINESSIDFIVESENNQYESNGKIKNNLEKEITGIPETNSNELELNPMAMLTITMKRK